MVMQKHKTSSGGWTCAAVPIDAPGFVERAETEVSCAALDNTAREAEARTRVALYTSGLVLVAAACAFAAMLWHRTYGSYNASLTAAFAKYGVVTLLAVTSLIAVSLVVAFAVRTKYSIDASARAFIAKTSALSGKQHLQGKEGRGRDVTVGTQTIDEMDLARAEIAEIEPCTNRKAIDSKEHTAVAPNIAVEADDINGTDPCVTPNDQGLEADSRTAVSAADSALPVSQDTSPVASSSAYSNVECGASSVSRVSSEPGCNPVTVVIKAPVVWCADQGGGESKAR